MLWASDGIPVTTNTDDGRQYSTIATDEAGGVLVIWNDSRNTETETDIYVQRVSGNGTRYWDPEGLAVCTAYHLQNSGDIVSDGAGGAIAVWDDCRAAWWGDCGFSGVYAQRVDENGSELWETNGVALTPYNPARLNTSLISDGSGGAIISWHEDYWGVYTQRIDPSGTKLWEPDGLLISSGAESQYDNRMIADGQGGAIVTWKDDLGNLNTDIYANRISAQGQLLWGTSGVAVCTAAREQKYHALISDGWGGAFFAWQDNRGGANTDDIYAQRITGSGSNITGVRDSSAPTFSLGQFAPNPFTGQATLRLELSQGGPVSIAVYDAAGRLVTSSHGSFAVGAHDLTFDGTDGSGRQLPSGIYFARVAANGSTVTRKMVIVR